ncbi:protein kinase [Streptomyces sp. A7024]|uniref:Protein kinase n=1 Tax=Streptomyces coryli TaxID=1128680 RepID=A0A6G4U7D3_9ACTN|nr:serine/threonine-protein kinase [Streptomyces coryli]NGN67207.1 protein kinase [Streptomyces coryli]
MPASLTHDDPQQLGPYRLVARLGSGGMGTVFLGRSAGGRTVALKTMHAEIASRTEFRARFRLETDAARVIGGYGAEVVDADPLAPTPWLATEYVLGPPLDEAVALTGPLPEDAVRALGAELCAGLAQLHGSDVVHRDLKPSNILLAAAGPKLIDFGIARAEGDERLTRTGTAAGTPAFMSPEQATGIEHTPAGDVFALAGVLVFACTGQAPFGSGQAADLLYRVRYGEPDLSRVPEALRPVLEQCLAKDPRQRPTTSRLAELLDAPAGGFAEHLPDAVHADILRRATAVWQPMPPRLPAPAEEAATAAGPAGPSRRRVLALAGGTVAAAGAAAGAWFWLGPEDDGEPTAGGKPGQKKPDPAPEPVWKVKVFKGDSGFNIYPAGRHLGLLSGIGLKFYDAKSGKLRGESGDSSPVQGLGTDGKRLYEHLQSEISAFDPLTGKTGKPVLRLKKKLSGGRIEDIDAHDVLMFAGLPGDKESSYALFDRRTGKLRWSHPYNAPNPMSYTVSLLKHYVVLREEDRLTVLDRKKGKVLWKWRAPKADRKAFAGLSALPLTETHLYLGLHEFTALRLEDGKKEWTFGKDRPAVRDAAAEDRVYGPCQEKDGTLYCVERGTGLLAVDQDTGELKWEAKAEWAGPDAFASAPAVGEKLVYVATGGTHWARAISLKTHREAWAYRGPGNAESPKMMPYEPGDCVLLATPDVVVALPFE